MTIDTFEREFVKPRPGRTLIVGSRVYKDKPDRRALYEPGNVLGVDMLEGPGVNTVIDMERPDPAERIGTFDHVECLSVLEHSERPWRLAANLETVMVPGATLFVSVPFCWPIHSYPDDYWRVSPAALEILFPSIEWVARRLINQTVLEHGAKIARHKVNGYPYFPRTETCGFGVKR